MLSKLTARKKIAFLLLGILLASDVLLVLLGLLDYSPGPRFHPSGGYIVLYHVILLSVSLVLLQKQLLLILSVSLILLLFGVKYFCSSFMGWQYEYLQSPRNQELLVVKYRIATLGESQYFAEFYRSRYFGLFMHKLENQDYWVMIRGEDRDPDTVLGLSSPTWKHERKVILDTASGEHTITLY
ncbi:hypothetical protein NSS79_18720 [Paenibacillus sp. FSL L8-0436]|uniref:hypothetical protein n=1 Tax=Paenibacillus sp. FSL L8-0436 TaxID=2954686 RepID=UPI0031580541